MDDSPQRYQVVVLKEGYSQIQTQGKTRQAASVTLVIGAHNIMVGTGLPNDGDFITRGLQKHGLTAENIEYVVCPHCSVDHAGNLGLFPNATFIVGYDIRKGDESLRHDFENEGIPYEIDDYVEVMPTPGHVNEATTVVIRSTQLGTVAITGGVFKNEEDLEDPEIWMECSQNADSQQQSRIDILKIADVIIPLHGSMFEVPKFYKSEMRVVMTP